MNTIPELVKHLRSAIAAELRGSLESRDKEWLIEEVIRLTLADASLQEIVRIDQQVQLAAQEQQYLTQTSLERETRVERVRALNLDERNLNLLLERLGGRDRAQLEREGHLRNPPEKGGALITADQRSDAGNALLREAKDLLYALLFGTSEMNVALARKERELLAMTLPRSKRFALDFMMAVSEVEVRGSWRDPKGGGQRRARGQRRDGG